MLGYLGFKLIIKLQLVEQRKVATSTNDKHVFLHVANQQTGECEDS